KQQQLYTWLCVSCLCALPWGRLAVRSNNGERVLFCSLLFFVCVAFALAPLPPAMAWWQNVVSVVPTGDSGLSGKVINRAMSFRGREVLLLLLLLLLEESRELRG
ncbi:unnamed protein product, partial [Laminaria digitata]